jgi:hypothetical protein
MILHAYKVEKNGGNKGSRNALSNAIGMEGAIKIK